MPMYEAVWREMMFRVFVLTPGARKAVQCIVWAENSAQAWETALTLADNNPWIISADREFEVLSLWTWPASLFGIPSLTHARFSRW